MRYTAALTLAALALAIGGTGTICEAQTPSGSYQQTCKNIGVRGSTLYANCKDTGGGWQSTQLADYQRCRGEIQNLNGSLQCTGGNNGYGQNANNGYGHDGDRDRDRDHDGDHDRGRDGDHGYGRNGVPYGSYSQTCQNIHVSGNSLQASCQKRNGKWKNTSLGNYHQCRGEIQNDNGKLRCR
jgi:hypothetical protein